MGVRVNEPEVALDILFDFVEVDSVPSVAGNACSRREERVSDFNIFQ